MKKRLLAAALVIALAITTLLACSSKEKDSETSTPKTETKDTKDTETTETTETTEKEETLPESTKVILNEVAHSIFYAPMYVAIEEGYFEDEGIELDLITGFGVIYLIQDIIHK